MFSKAFRQQRLLENLGLRWVSTSDISILIGIEFDENTVERGLFYQALNVVLEIMLDEDLELADYEVNFRRMFGKKRMHAVLGSVNGSVRFFGLMPTSMKLEGLDRHQRLVDSYRKLHVARAKAHGK